MYHRAFGVSRLTHIQSIIPRKSSVLDYHSFGVALSAIQPTIFLLHATTKVGKSKYIPCKSGKDIATSCYHGNFEASQYFSFGSKIHRISTREASAIWTAMEMLFNNISPDIWFGAMRSRVRRTMHALRFNFHRRDASLPRVKAQSWSRARVSTMSQCPAPMF